MALSGRSLIDAAGDDSRFIRALKIASAGPRQGNAGRAACITIVELDCRQMAVRFGSTPAASEDACAALQ
jgi:hypothetical protein